MIKYEEMGIFDLDQRIALLTKGVTVWLIGTGVLWLILFFYSTIELLILATYLLCITNFLFYVIMLCFARLFRQIKFHNINETDNENTE